MHSYFVMNNQSQFTWGSFQLTREAMVRWIFNDPERTMTTNTGWEHSVIVLFF